MLNANWDARRLMEYSRLAIRNNNNRLVFRLFAIVLSYGTNSFYFVTNNLPYYNFFSYSSHYILLHWLMRLVNLLVTYSIVFYSIVLSYFVQCAHIICYQCIDFILYFGQSLLVALSAI